MKLGWDFLLCILLPANLAFAQVPLLPNSASPSLGHEGVRTEILGYSNRPTVQAYFERMDKVNGLQDCMFEQLSGDASSADVESWTATVSTLNQSQWTKKPGVSDTTFGNCFRSDFVDQNMNYLAKTQAEP